MQFDLFANPITAARAAYPYVTVMQSDLSPTAQELIVAPLAPRNALPTLIGRLAPVVVVDDAEYVVLVSALTGIRRRYLNRCIGSLAAKRTELLTAIDYLFFGV